MFERAFSWCMSNLPVEPVELGEKQREVLAIDSSTIARKASQGRNGFVRKRLPPSGRQSDQSQHHHLFEIAAVCEPLPIGPWDRRPQPTAGRLANYLDIQIHNFVALAESGSQIQKLPKNSNPSEEQGFAVPRYCARLVKHEFIPQFKFGGVVVQQL